MTRYRLSRRTVLRGTLAGSGVVFGLPALQPMLNDHGTALADGTPLPQRFGVFFWGNGMKVDRWTPSGTGTAWDFSPALAPLTSLKEYLTVVTGTTVAPSGIPHHEGTTGVLSGAGLENRQMGKGGAAASTFKGPSLDQIAARVIGTTTPRKSLEVGVIRNGVYTNEGTTLHYLSHNGKDNFNPPEYDPTAVFNSLFGAGNGGTTGGGPDPLLIEKAGKLRKSVIDVVHADLRRIRARVGTSDRTRIDQHVENFRAIEKQIITTPMAPTITVTTSRALCGSPKAPDPALSPMGKFFGGNEAMGKAGSAEPIEERGNAMARLIALALACDRTRVFSNLFSGSGNDSVYTPVGATRGTHEYTHSDKKDDQDMVHTITTFNMKQLAFLCESLKNVQEGATTLLYNCAIVATSEQSEGKDHHIKEFPMLIVGRAGGKLRGGVHYRSTTSERTSKAVLSTLRAVGVPLANHGADGNETTVGIPAIET